MVTALRGIGIFLLAKYLLIACSVAAPNKGHGGKNDPGTKRSPPGPRQFKAKCNSGSLYVGWTHMEPYIVRVDPDAETDNSQSAQGVMYSFLERLVQTCCGNGTTLSLRTRYANQQDMESSVFSDTTFNLPVIKTQLQQIFDESRPNYTFLPIIETPGTIYLQTTTLPANTLVWEVIKSCWPLLVLVVTSAGIAGIVMWLLDAKWNPGQFPSPFIRGSWEGFWWAFVTMTTVGYGDRSPVSLPGRLFGILWILVGLIILSIFTATVTSSITAGNLGDTNFRGKDVGVLNGTIAYRVALAQGGVPRAYNNLDNMLLDVEKGERIIGALVEYFQYSVASTKYSTSGMDVAKEIPLPAFIGVSVYAGADDFRQCLIDTTIRDRHSVYTNIGGIMQHFKSKSERIEQVSADLLSNTQLIIICFAGILVFLIAVFLLRDLLIKNKKRSMSVGDIAKCNNTSDNPSDQNQNKMPI